MENFGINYIIKVDQELIKIFRQKFYNENLLKTFDELFARALCRAMGEVPNPIIQDAIRARDFFDSDRVLDQFKVSVKPIIANILMKAFKWENEKCMIVELVARGIYMEKNDSFWRDPRVRDVEVDKIKERFEVYRIQ